MIYKYLLMLAVIFSVFFNAEAQERKSAVTAKRRKSAVTVKRRKPTEIKVPTAVLFPDDSLSPETEELTEVVIATKTQEGDPNAEEVILDATATPVRNKDGLWGYKDEQGQWVIQPQFYFAGNFHDGLAKVRKGRNGLSITINKQGRCVAGCP